MISKSVAKYIQSLDHKKNRDEHEVFIAEGPKLVEELLSNTGFNFKLIAALPEWLAANDHLLQRVNVDEVLPVQPHELENVSKLKHPNKVLAVVYKQHPRELLLDNKLSLALDGIQDPGNMGTIIRIADWFGIEHLICSHGCVDIYNPKVVQATMGSIANVNIVFHDIQSLIEDNANATIYAAMLEGTKVNKVKPAGTSVLLIGNEGHGINPSLVKLVTEKITIPRRGKAESLNAAMATGILLSHLTGG
jgi:RNA methyltransferase, TrmH family